MSPHSIRRTLRGTAWSLIVLLLVTVAFAPRNRIAWCTGDCCASGGHGDARQTAHADRDRPAHDSCCCSEQEAGDDAHQHRSKSSSVRGTCKPGCRVSVVFDVDLLLDAHPLPPVGVVAATGWLATFASVLPVAHAIWRTPLDRGPPRLDDLAARRRCTVMLI